MNKYIYENLINSIKRGLNESGLFDDDDDDLIYIDDDEDLSNVISDNLKITSLLQCDTEEDVNGYFMDKTNVFTLVKDALEALTNKTTLPDYVEKTEWGYDTWWIVKINGENWFEIRFENADTDIIYRNKTLHACDYYITYRDDNTKKLLWHYFIPKNPYTTKLERSPKQDKAIADYNMAHDAEYNLNLYNFILSYISYKYNTKRIAEELSCEGKVYTVTQKDIDRMRKCLDTGQYSGFDAIRKPDKLVARLAALFIVADKENITDMKLAFNDDILMQVLTGKIVGSTTRALKTGNWILRPGIYRRSYNPNYITVLKKIRLFPDVHLKDIIATYKAYKNKF